MDCHEIFMVLIGYIFMTLVIHTLFVWRHKQVKSFTHSGNYQLDGVAPNWLKFLSVLSEMSQQLLDGLA